MYPKDQHPQTENTPINPIGKKAVVRAEMVGLLQEKIKRNEIEAVICRAPEFYGPKNTQSVTNKMVFEPLKERKIVRIPITDKQLRTLIWTPDASRAMALIGNTPDTFGQTWHLPCAESKSYYELMKIAEEVLQRQISYKVVPMWQFKLGSLFNKELKELKELLPRYQVDNLFVSDKFKHRFPEFKITSFKEGINQLMAD